MIPTREAGAGMMRMRGQKMHEALTFCEKKRASDLESLMSCLLRLGGS